MNKQRIDEFKIKFPTLTGILEKLTEHGIDWMIGGSGCLFLLGNDRTPDDVDIFIKSGQHDKADQIFGIKSFVYMSPLEHVRNSNPTGDHSLQLTSNLKITVGNKIYDLDITPEMFEQSQVSDGIRLLPPEDVLLIKALLQRGVDVNKHDIEDIKKFESIYSINNQYLKKRIDSLDAEERVHGII